MKKRITFIFFITASLISCGGGGGNKSLNQFDFSNAVMADPTLENGEKIEETAAVNQQNQYSLNSVSSDKNPNTVFLFNTLINSINQFQQTEPYALNMVIDPEPCSYRGYISGVITGLSDISDWGSDYTLNANFDQCSEVYGITLNGNVLMSFGDYNSTYDEYDRVYAKYLSDFSINIDDTSLGALSATILAGSNQDIEYLSHNSFGPITSDMKITAVTIVDGNKVALQNAHVRSTLNILYPYEMYYRSGRFYIDNLTAYADYDESWDMSQTPFIFDSFSGEINSGEARFNLANGGKARIVGTGGEPITYVDADGDGFFELVEN